MDSASIKQPARPNPPTQGHLVIFRFAELRRSPILAAAQTSGKNLCTKARNERTVNGPIFRLACCFLESAALLDLGPARQRLYHQVVEGNVSFCESERNELLCRGFQLCCVLQPQNLRQPRPRQAFLLLRLPQCQPIALGLDLHPERIASESNPRFRCLLDLPAVIGRDP